MQALWPLTEASVIHQHLATEQGSKTEACKGIAGIYHGLLATAALVYPPESQEASRSVASYVCVLIETAAGQGADARYMMLPTGHVQSYIWGRKLHASMCPV